MKYIIGEDYLCLFAVLEMVLKDIGVQDYSQYDLANYFGVTVPEEYLISGVHNLKYSNMEKDYGTHVTEKDLNAFFNEKGIPLMVEWLSANPFGEYPDAVYIPNDRYVIFLFSYGSLYQEPQNYTVGHASLLLENESHGMIKIYDPGPRNHGEKDVSINNLYDAVYDGRGGILIFNKVNV